jgi:predicted PurR-regulated permease PerM
VLMTTDEPFYFGIRVALLFLLVQFTENYVLTPNIVGGNVKINPLFIIIGLIAGGLIWGIPGMLVIIPFLAILKIIFGHIPNLAPYAYLLGLKGTLKYAITFRKIKSALLKRNQK